MRTLAVACLAMLGGPLMASDSQNVTVKASVTKAKKNQFVVSVSLDVKAGWHTYLSVAPGSSSTVTTASFEVPRGVKKVGELVKPFGQPYLSEPGSEVLIGRGTFSQKFEMSDKASGQIKVTVKYQACDDQRCMRPTSDTVSVAIPSASSSPFDAPIRLFSGKKPLNVAARQMYPSPAWYDVDGDGQSELVVGDIFGTLNVYKNKNTTGKGDPVWSEHTPLKNADGERIKVSNW